MPRPGPRPYECVRRAWHSDGDQPIRGPLIQEVFRVVNEIHGSATRENKEWQEKLPIVVLEAEKIMYSKANSEAEYIDRKTLWDRVNDAINTVIRRDESTETGGLLQPCIEAALSLGCRERKGSRSQRNSNPRFYLSPNTQEPTSMPPRVSENVTFEGSPYLLPPHSSIQTTDPRFNSNYSTFTRPTTMNLNPFGSRSCTPVIQDNNPTTPHELHFSSENYSGSDSNKSIPMETFPMSSLGYVYPLHYGTNLQSEDRRLSFQVPQNLNSEMGILQNLFPCERSYASNRITEVEFRDVFENPPATECDLSLRLGLLSASCVSAEKSWTHEVEDIGSSSSI
ncbi:hypothetical protein HHK36_025812 [Tetracentron sinense]|uniref:Histone acetyltransferase n=1 Tax=Tetracentron sinense TaxID=13715 RepID=A0A834YL76_TETSI|nr:hypothetical protein HHK36_025812 [Tetracentron sinense]